MDLLDLQLVIDRLKSACPPPILKEVGGLAELGGAASTLIKASPSAFVVPVGESAYEVNEGSGPLRQGFDVTFAVITGVTLSGPRGEAAMKALRAPLAAVRQALFGWQHPAAVTRCVCGSGGLEDFNAQTGVTLFRSEFMTRVRLLENLS